MKYRPNGVCSQLIDFQVEDGKLTHVRFTSGCDGNLQGISHLVEGMPVDEVIRRLEGIRCGRKSTSCPDQLAQALRAYQASQA